MSAVRAFFVGLREVFVLEQAEARARALSEAERSHRIRYLRAARLRRAASRKLSSPVAALVLLRDALALALRAAHGDDTDLDLTAELEAVTADDARVAAARQHVVEVLAARSPLVLDELPFAEAEALRGSFEECLATVVGRLDTRSVTAVRALRIARPLAVVLLLAWLAVTFARARWLVHNVAVGKVVTSTPLRGESPTADHVVDGQARGTFGIATVDADQAFVMVDLGGGYSLDRVRVFNRGDGWFDDCLPLVMEVSDDGVRFEQVARRDEHFDQWTVSLGGRAAHFVRLSKPDRGYIALNEIEVYGRALR